MSQQINLFNPAFQKRREWFTALMLLQALAALLLIMAGAGDAGGRDGAAAQG